MEWLSHSQKKYCELCKTHFRFTKLYSSQMPQTLPIPIFLRQLVVHIVRSILAYARTVLVIFVWLGWLPWSIRHVWGALFYLADGRWALVHGLKPDISSVHFSAQATSVDENSTIPLFRQINFTRHTTASGTHNFLAHRSDDLLVTKLFRILLPRFYQWTIEEEISRSSEDSPQSSFDTRHPSNGSLLSDVKCLQNAFSNPRLNRILIQTLEGQLICLCIVATFILVFLIREWVINQQPLNERANNDEAPDQEATPAPTPPAGLEGEDHGREANQRHAVRHGDRPRRMIALPRRRREHIRPDNPNVNPPSELLRTSSDQVVPSSPGNIAHNQQSDAQQLIPDDSLDSFQPTHEEQPLDAIYQDEQLKQLSKIRPGLRARNTDQAPNIQRNLEENRPTFGNQEWPGLETFKSLWERGDSDPTQVLRIIDEEGRRGELGWIVTQMENLQRSSKHQGQGDKSSPEQSVLQDSADKILTIDPPDLIGLTSQDATPNSSLKNSDRGSSSSPNSLHVAPFTAEFPQPTTQDRAGPTSNQVVPDDHDGGHPNRAATGTLNASTESLVQEPQAERSVRINYTDHQMPEHVMEHDDAPPEDINASGTQDAIGSVAEIERSVHEDVTDAAVGGNRPPNDSIFERIATKLWGNANEPQETNDENAPGEDDEQIVQDIEQEPPFVPVPTANHINSSDRDDEDNSEAEDTSQTSDEVPANDTEQDTRDNRAAEDGPDPEVVAAAAEAGIDLNNAEAIDDAEDMDGILELVGLRGPLTGLLQNALFSDFLLTFTIAACIWLPYVWGKITAVFLANPIACFITVPLQFASRTADTTLDLLLYLTGSLFGAVESILQITSHLIYQVFPSANYGLVPTISGKRVSEIISTGSASRIESTFDGIIFSITPDFPTFSAGSHAALIVLKTQTKAIARKILRTCWVLFYEYPSIVHDRLFDGSAISSRSMNDDVATAISEVKARLQDFEGAARMIINDLKSLKIRLHRSEGKVTIDYSLVYWSTQDRILAILLGYAFFALMGYLYLRVGRYLHGLKNGEKLQGPVADTLRQAGGVLKVVLIIGIEMIIFPLYCGLLLDAALLPIFEGVSLKSRISFIVESPMTGLFVHWFIGTCYMFHFALFVSMCRRILRKGCLYFIRDPDDPTFHPVRDVLERPIATQLNKIMQSALVYGCLVILCLGVVVWTVSNLGDFFPIYWASGQPRLEIPWDLLYFNFALPFLLRNVELSGHITSLYSWWFHKCAKFLRLSDFLFGKRQPSEEGRHIRRRWIDVLRGKKGDVQSPVIGEDRQILAQDREKDVYFLRDGKFVRAPASDSVRMRRGESAFLEVTENNERVDGGPDPDSGPHGRKNTKYQKVYLPPNFRTRIGLFVLSVWLFAAFTGAVVILLPLTLGRRVIATMVPGMAPINDLYAVSLGVNLCLCCFGGITFGPIAVKALASKLPSGKLSFTDAMLRLRSSITHIVGLGYLVLAFAFALPLLFSVTAEMYFFLPLHTYMNSIAGTHYGQLAEKSPTIYIIQSWVLGLLYTRCVYRLATTYPSRHSRAAIAIRAITRKGIHNPDVALATRAFLLPACCLCGFLLVLPAPLGWILNHPRIGPFGFQSQDIQDKISNYSYPGLLGLAIAAWCAILVKRALGRWRMRIRDEVYLIGERLHNFGEQRSGVKPRREGPVRTNSVTTRVDVGL
ncbi:MAG: hypothetical protein Q9160_002774 [Pyrenula sp. 1 TL-2023]